MVTRTQLTSFVTPLVLVKVVGTAALSERSVIITLPCSFAQKYIVCNMAQQQITRTMHQFVQLHTSLAGNLIPTTTVVVHIC